MSDHHDELWKRALAAIEARGALAPGALTAREIAAAADRRLQTDLVQRLVEGYYQPRRYGGPSALNDDEAQALVAALEALPSASTEPPLPAAAAPRRGGPTTAPDYGSAGGTLDEIEAEPVGLEQATSDAEAAEDPASNAQAETVQAPGGEAPQSAEAWRELGDAQREAGAYAAAIESYEKSRALDPTVARTHNQIGVCYDNLDLLQKALEFYREAVRLNPEGPVLLYNLGRTYERLEHYADAETYLRRSAAAGRDDPDAWRALGRVLYHLRREAEALGALQTAVVLEPRRANTWAWIGWTKSRLEDWAGAAEAFAKATELDPTSRREWDDLANALTKAGRAGEARKVLAVASRKAGPSNTKRAGRSPRLSRVLVLAMVMVVAVVAVMAIRRAASVP